MVMHTLVLQGAAWNDDREEGRWARSLWEGPGGADRERREHDPKATRWRSRFGERRTQSGIHRG